jgi:D-alanyl-D-alanine carboxypeptidase/D-alanyl-D-alanine carboxypeptidase (penicillin-binding protein 5/6)
LLIRHAISNTTFNRIFSVKIRPWYGKGNETKILTSPNKLFWSYDGIEGGKTGYNKKELQTIISTAVRSNMKLISVVLDSPESTMYTDAAALFDYGFQNFRKSTLVHKGEVLKTAVMEGHEINLVSQSDIIYVHPLGESYIQEFSATADLKPPIKKTSPAGSASYILKDGTKVEIVLYPEKEIIPPDDLITSTRKKILENKDIFYLVLFLIVVEALLILFNIGKLVKKIVLLLIKRSGRHRRRE